MKYSVIVPVYNEQDTIRSCLLSIINQRGVTLGRDYEILLVDDGSTDGTMDRAKGHPVRTITLPENQGRIVARLTGAREASADRLLFIDSRVTIPDGTLSLLSQFDSYPAVVCVSENEQNRPQKGWELVFYLIRRKYYGKKYYPLQTDELLITRENFKRAPKGTTLLLIDRELFLRLTPTRTGRTVNDDTLLLQRLVFSESVDLLRTGKIRCRYHLRTGFKKLSRWLFDRGTRFADFYLSPGGYYFYPFLFSTAAVTSILTFGLISPFSFRGFLIFVLLCGLISYLALVVFLVESKRDFLSVIFRLPVLLAIFGGGVLRYWCNRLFRSDRHKAPIAERTRQAE